MYCPELKSERKFFKDRSTNKLAEIAEHTLSQRIREWLSLNIEKSNIPILDKNIIKTDSLNKLRLQIIW